MTEKDAIIQLNFDMEMIRFNPETGENLTLEQIKSRNEDNYKTYLADEVAITALMEIQSYRAIGTVEDLQKLKGVITDFPLDCGSPIKSIAEIWNQLKKYLAIGTIEDFKALKEKNTPKKIEYQIGKNGLKHEKCPTCGSFRVFGNYCTCCGQRLDWKMKGE